MQRLTDEQLKEAEQRALLSGIPLHQCPTCLSVADAWGEREGGIYRLDGEEHDCDCREQIRRRGAYLYANIPDLYQRLSWDDYQVDDRTQEAVQGYLGNWPSFKINGMGLAFLSKGLGNGKTLSSILIGKELIMRGESVFFLPHNQLTQTLRYNDTKIIEKLNTVTVIILDDIAAPPHDKLEGIFAENLESVIRNRTNYNGITLISSNLPKAELEYHYPRVWSVLEPKVMVVEINGEDARQSFVALNTLERALNNEVKPIV